MVDNNVSVFERGKEVGQDEVNNSKNPKYNFRYSDRSADPIFECFPVSTEFVIIPGPANCPACRGSFIGLFGSAWSVSKKPNDFKAESLHNTNLSDVTRGAGGRGQAVPHSRKSAR